MNKKQGVFLNEIKAESTDATIDIVGVIGWEVAFTEIKKMFSALPETVKRVCFEIYSPGGDVWDGNGIVQAIGELGKTRETVARVQVAASMATLIAVACNKRSIASNGRFLVHNAWTSVQGDAAELEKRAKELRDCEIEAANFYASRTGKTAEEMLALMNEERWLTPDETKSFGFVQEIDDPFKPEEVESVRAEIEAAGKWPQALVEIPKAETCGVCGDCGHQQKEMNPPCAKCGSQNVKSGEWKDNQDENADTNGSKGKGKGNQTDAGKSGNTASDFESGVIEGRVLVETEYAAKLADLSGQILALKKSVTDFESKIKDLDALQRRTQGERDSARAQSEKLTVSLKDATAQIERLLAGGMSFAPVVETWADAMKTCGGDYEAARKRFPDLYKAQRDQDKTNRK